MNAPIQPRPTQGAPRSSRGALSLSAGLALALALGAAQEARALQGGEDPALLPVLIDKRFGSGGRHHLGVQFSTAMVAKFVEATGAYLTYAYNFSDIFGVEIGGGYFFGSESSIMKEVRLNFGAQEPPLSDLYQLQFTGGADVIITPIYGKMSFASEVDPSFDLFLVLGAGVAGVRRQVGSEGAITYDSKIAPAFNFGVGFRFYFNRLIALRLEFRDYFYPEQTNLGDPPPGGLTFNLHFQGGVQFAFGGDE